MRTKKSGAQLDREIAEALRRSPSTRRNPIARAPKRPKRPVQSHARTKKTNSKQAEILMVANDAALSGQFDRAEKILEQGQQRKIATAYKTTTPESAAEGDYADRGWEDEEGDAIEVGSYEIEEQAEAASQAPVTDAIVKQAVRWLQDHGAIEASSSRFDPGVWYSSEAAMDYSSGEDRMEDFFLRNFTEDEGRRVFQAFHR